MRYKYKNPREGVWLIEPVPATGDEAHLFRRQIQKIAKRLFGEGASLNSCNTARYVQFQGPRAKEMAQQVAKVWRRSVVSYTSCPDCPCWSLGVLGNGRIVRHSIGCGSVEKVGPGTNHPTWRTTICSGSGKLVSD